MAEASVTTAISEPTEHYTRGELRQLRLDKVPYILIAQYVGALLPTLLPAALVPPVPAWAFICLPLLAPIHFLVYRAQPLLGAAALVVSWLVAWSVVLALQPSLQVALLGVLVVGGAAALLGARAGLMAAVLVTVAAGVAVHRGGLDANDALCVVIAIWGVAGALWLTAQPSETTLEWAWHSYADARDSQHHLRLRQGELNATLRSLEVAYQKLEHLNDELNRAWRAAEHARQLKSAFAAAISHELRTPLNLILGFSEMMVTAPHVYGAGALPPAYQPDIDVVYRNARHLADLIDDVLDLSQIESSRLALIREPSQLGRVVDEAARAVAARFETLGLSLDVDVPHALPPVSIDRTRIRQVLINLLNNAARFTDRGGANVVVRPGDNEILVSVADTGVGIEPDNLTEIFDEFYQTPSAAQRQVGGSGLGLPIAKRLVELHGGSMWAASEPGRGTTVSFSLPLTENVATSTVPGDWVIWDRIARERDAEPPTVAVLAPDEAVARFFQRYLIGFTVTSAENREQVLSLAQTTSLRGLIVASSSPEEAWRTVFQFSDDGTGLPIVLCSAPGWRNHAAEFGVREYMVKPVSRDKLERALGRLGNRVRNVLVVDDNFDMVRLLTRTIRAFGQRYRVWQAFGGQDALRLMGEHRPDAVLLDLLMPDVDGTDVLVRMRADQRLRDVPVIILTATGESNGESAVALLGFTRPGGYSVDETMHLLKSHFDAIRPVRRVRSAPDPLGGRSALPALEVARPHPGSGPTASPAEPSR